VIAGAFGSVEQDETDREDLRGMAELLLAKPRSGPTCSSENNTGPSSI